MVVGGGALALDVSWSFARACQFYLFLGSFKLCLIWYMTKYDKYNHTSFIIDSLSIGSWTAGACPLTIYECINKGCALILGMSNSSVWIIIIFYNLTDQFCSFSLYWSLCVERTYSHQPSFYYERFCFTFSI